MATAALIPLTEYLQTSYEPDAEFVDGRIEERPMGDRDHADLQSQILLLLGAEPFQSQFLARTELRIQIRPQRFRVPDVCILRAGIPRERIVLTPPLLCIEILSPDDTMQRTLVRVRDFLSMGVPEVWVVDPDSRSVQVCRGETMIERSSGSLTVPETSVALSLEKVFRVLDQL